jgi:hypothetical protein
MTKRQQNAAETKRVRLFNEDSVQTWWSVPAHLSEADANREAWRLYRELDYVDNEDPPAWALKSHIGMKRQLGLGPPRN